MTNSLYFYNNGTLDKRAFTMLGLSAKSDDTAVGFFGTGFKYAIATLLRHGAIINVRVRDERMSMDDLGDDFDTYTTYSFYVEAGRFRDRSFDFIYCSIDGDEVIELPYTTHLGANWKVWQAYRELYTNCVLDEGGGVCVYDPDMAKEIGDVVITVSNCPEILDVHNQHDKYFLSDDVKVIAAGSTMRCVEKVPDSDNAVYYKTMYTGTRLDKPTVLTYDYTCKIALTEDRTIADTWYIRHHISEVWAEKMDYDALIKYLPMIANKEGYYEYGLVYEYSDSVSPAFKKACEYLISQHIGIPMWARDVYVKTRPFGERITEFKLSRYQYSQLSKALNILDYHGCMIDPDTIVPCVSLPADVLGYYRDNKLYIAKECFDKGFMTLMGTVYEEHLHHTKDVADTSRAMQNILVDKVASLMIQVFEMDTMTDSDTLNQNGGEE